MLYLCCLVIIGLGADLLANPQNGWWSSFAPAEIAKDSQVFSPPGSRLEDGRVFYLGTDNIGHDVLSRVIHGIRPALIIGVSATAIGLLVALLLGGIAGYYGNRLRVSLISLVLIVLAGGVIGYQLWCLQYVTINGDLFKPKIIVLAYLSGWIVISFLLSKIRLEPMVYLPLDKLLIKFLEIKRAIPSLMLFIVILSLVGTLSVWGISTLIGLLTWTSMARITRAQYMRYKEEDFVKAAYVLGLSDWHIATKQILPNVLPSVMVVAAFNIGAAILLESSLSFLQIGLNGEVVSLGRLLAQSREYFRAWWVVLPSGFIIFSMIITINSLSERIQEFKP